MAMLWREMHRGDYLTAVEFNGRTPTFTIVEVKMVELANPETGEVKPKGTIRFKEIDRGMVVNVTNSKLIAAMFGEDTKDAIGKRITLKAEEVQVGKEKDLGIRVIGSPDISAPIDVVVALPRKKPVKVRLVPTGKREPGAEG